jgi:hypothetical protein
MELKFIFTYCDGCNCIFFKISSQSGIHIERATSIWGTLLSLFLPFVLKGVKVENPSSHI